MILGFIIITINKSQEQKFGIVGVSLPETDFALPQLHVVISTTREENRLKIFVPGAANQENVWKTQILYTKYCACLHNPYNKKLRFEFKFLMVVVLRRATP